MSTVSEVVWRRRLAKASKSSLRLDLSGGAGTGA